MKVCGRSKKIEKWERRWGGWDIMVEKARCCCYGRNFPLFHLDNHLPPLTWPNHRYHSSYRECTDTSIPLRAEEGEEEKQREFWKTNTGREGKSRGNKRGTNSRVRSGGRIGLKEKTRERMCWVWKETRKKKNWKKKHQY